VKAFNMNSSDTCIDTQNQCGCASKGCCKTSSAESLFASIQSGNIICNLGTSSGFHIKTASENAGTAGKVIVIAAVPSLLNSVQKEIISYGITNADLRLGDIDSLPIESNSVDIIAGENSLAANQNRDIVFKEFNRILRIGSRLVLSEIIGFCVASSLIDTHKFGSLKTMLSDELDQNLRLNGFSSDNIIISVDEKINYSNTPDTAPAIALKAFIRASKV
jgi:SAM-dependent methyltransferase